MFGDQIVKNLNKRGGISVTARHFINRDAIEFLLLAPHSGRVRTITFTGVDAIVRGEPWLIARLAEATVSLEMDEQPYLNLH